MNMEDCIKKDMVSIFKGLWLIGRESNWNNNTRCQLKRYMLRNLLLLTNISPKIHPIQLISLILNFLLIQQKIISLYIQLRIRAKEIISHSQFSSIKLNSNPNQEISISQCLIRDFKTYIILAKKFLMWRVRLTLMMKKWKMLILM